VGGGLFSLRPGTLTRNLPYSRMQGGSIEECALAEEAANFVCAVSAAAP
jgi:hypothetical protein